MKTLWTDPPERDLTSSDASSGKSKSLEQTCGVRDSGRWSSVMSQSWTSQLRSEASWDIKSVEKTPEKVQDHLHWVLTKALWLLGNVFLFLGKLQTVCYLAERDSGQCSPGFLDLRCGRWRTPSSWEGLIWSSDSPPPPPQLAVKCSRTQDTGHRTQDGERSRFHTLRKTRHTHTQHNTVSVCVCVCVLCVCVSVCVHQL